ncbi:hypothetical protein [Luminiphilus sp. nBUS_16]|uniref:hypothetical protein n=1 Tax=unclassified Luminiphilus TaxID=2633198 RepID=UPI003EBBB6FA
MLPSATVIHFMLQHIRIDWRQYMYLAGHALPASPSNGTGVTAVIAANRRYCPLRSILRYPYIGFEKVRTQLIARCHTNL